MRFRPEAQAPIQTHQGSVIRRVPLSCASRAAGGGFFAHAPRLYILKRFARVAFLACALVQPSPSRFGVSDRHFPTAL